MMSCRIAERDWRDEVGIQSVHVAPFSHVLPFTCHGLFQYPVRRRPSRSGNRFRWGGCPSCPWRGRARED
jgi:hypothetical protein